MSLPVAVLGDGTDHGGKIVTASDTHTINGKPIARLHDLVDCPEHGINRIAEAHPTLTVGGIRVALHGHHTECGWLKRCYWGVLEVKDRYQNAEIEIKELSIATGN